MFWLLSACALGAVGLIIFIVASALADGIGRFDEEWDDE